MSKVESGTEFINERGQTVWNDKSGNITFDNNSGQERLQFSHSSGANLNFNNKTVSMFAPNNKQELIYGDKFSTTAGDVFYNRSLTKKREHLVTIQSLLVHQTSLFKVWIMIGLKQIERLQMLKLVLNYLMVV